MTVLDAASALREEALPVSSVSHPIDRVREMFDDPNLVADAGLILPATLMVRLGLERALVNDTVARWSGWRVAAGPQGPHAGGPSATTC